VRAGAYVPRWLGVLTWAAIMLTGSAVMAEEAVSAFPPDFAARLATAKEIYVATQRKDGTRSAAVPVWFAVMDNAIWFTTSPTSHKVKRVRRGSPMFVSLEGKDGPFIKTQAAIIKDGALADRLGEIYAKKYWIAWLGFFRPSRARNDSGKTVLLKLTPEE
jgi:hypothetical protein